MRGSFKDAAYAALTWFLVFYFFLLGTAVFFLVQSIREADVYGSIFWPIITTIILGIGVGVGLIFRDMINQN